jgi:hypothetical protein
MAEPAWPSVERQLDRDGVVRGSALERLVRDNQEFHLLRPEEASDQLGLPPWLRVYWRKQHPEHEYRARDPTGGYPRALRNLHSWMVTHQDLRPDQDPPTTDSATP